MKILIIKIRSLGDTLLISPLIKNLYNFYDNPNIDILANKNSADILRFNPFVKNLILYDKSNLNVLPFFKKLANFISLVLSIKKQKYDIVIDLDEADRGAIISYLSSAKVRIGSSNLKNKFLIKSYTSLFRPESTLHVVRINLLPLKNLGIKTKNISVKVYLGKENTDFLSTELCQKGFIHIHPFSQGEYKDIEPTIIARIIDFCQNTINTEVVLTSSSSERELDLAHKIVSKCKSKPTTFLGNLTIHQINFLNKKSTLFLGSDTAIMHISAANNIPTIAIFGPSNPVSWGPWSNKFGASYSKGKKLQINHIHRVITSEMECQPCFNLGCNNSRDSQCMKNFDIDLVQNTISSLLKE